MAEMITIQGNEKLPAAILVGLDTERDAARFERSMRELKELAKACDLNVVSTITQSNSEVSQATLIGSGKVEEVKPDVISHADPESGKSF